MIATTYCALTTHLHLVASWDVSPKWGLCTSCRLVLRTHDSPTLGWCHLEMCPLRWGLSVGVDWYCALTTHLDFVPSWDVSSKMMTKHSCRLVLRTHDSSRLGWCHLELCPLRWGFTIHVDLYCALTTHLHLVPFWTVSSKMGIGYPYWSLLRTHDSPTLSWCDLELCPLRWGLGIHIDLYCALTTHLDLVASWNQV